ncbi:hypothetical protein [Marinobacter shengliensis]|uniref:hypothetical protein n=1 Tax=Marinobacter shengliensis TaxID=1389223 RepID=UPI001108F71A|nr:hypothetical protein [Marinobacter shengliensis]
MKLSGPSSIMLGISIIPAISFGAYFAYDQLREPEPVHTSEKVLHAIKQSERIRQTAEPDSIREAREGSNFQFTLGVDGTLESKPLPGGKVSRFTFEVHSAQECLDVPEIFLSNLQHPATVVFGTTRTSVDLWLGSVGKSLCSAAFESRDSEQIHIEFI